MSYVCTYVKNEYGHTLLGGNLQVLLAVLHSLGISADPSTWPALPPPLFPAADPCERRAVVPYDRRGVRSDTVRMVLDLRDGAEIVLSACHNHQVGFEKSKRPSSGVG